MPLSVVCSKISFVSSMLPIQSPVMSSMYLPIHTSLGGGLSMRCRVLWYMNVFARKTEIEALDLKLRIVNNKIELDICQKPMEGHQYLHANSGHPPHMKPSTVKSQLMRFRRNISDQDTFKKRSDELLQKFCERGYERSMLNETKVMVSQMARDNLLGRNTTQKAKEARMNFIVPFRPATAKTASKAVKKLWTPANYLSGGRLPSRGLKDIVGPSCQNLVAFYRGHSRLLSSVGRLEFLLYVGPSGVPSLCPTHQEILAGFFGSGFVKTRPCLLWRS